MTSRRRRSRSALSLVEVLLALAIMLMSLTAINYLVDLGSNLALEARFQARGTRLAEAKMAEVEAGVIAVGSAGDQSGTFDDDPSWSWTISTQQPGPTNLYQVTVTVRRTLRGKPFETTLTQMMLDPTQTGSSAQAEQPTTGDLTAATATAGTGATGVTGVGGTSP